MKTISDAASEGAREALEARRRALHVDEADVYRCEVCDHAFTSRIVERRSRCLVVVCDVPSADGAQLFGLWCCHWCSWRLEALAEVRPHAA